MAYYFLFSEKDTTLYSHPDRIHMNTGGGEILEIAEEKATTGNTFFASRVLIQFKNTEIKDVIENKLTVSSDPSNYKVALIACDSDFADKIRCATYPPPPGSAPGYQALHHCTEIGIIKSIFFIFIYPLFYFILILSSRNYQ